MSLRKKTLIWVSLALSLLVVAIYFASQFTVYSGFSQLEKDSTYQNVERVLNVLSSQIDALDSTNTDWASWDDTYEFIEDADTNVDYIESNLVDGTFIELKVNFMLFIDLSGNIIFKEAFDLENEAEVDVSQDLLGQLSSTDSLLLQHSDDADSYVAGMLSLSDGPLLISSRSILTSEDEGPSRGTLIMGRYMSDVEVQQLEELTQLSLSLHLVDDPQLSSDLQAELLSSSEETPISVHPLNGDVVAGYGLLNDIYGNPSLVLQVDLPRDIYNQGQHSIDYLLISLIVLGIIFGALIIFTLERFLLSRLARLRNNVNDIAFGQGPSARVLVEGGDELSDLASDVNEMLNRLEQSYDREYKLRQEREAEIERRIQFTRALVHELKTPLTPIMASSGLLMEELQEGTLLSLAKNVNRGAHTLDQRINELLDMAKGEMNTLELNRRDIDPLQLLQSVGDEETPVASNKGHVLNLELPSSLSLIWADENRLRQVLFNLLNNAFKFTPEGGKITLRAKDEDDTLVVEVQDSGPGIPEESQQNIFEPYYRLEADRQSLSGLGLGLALCKIIVELHGGRIWVHSELGKGSTFGFSIPRHSS